MALTKSIVALITDGNGQARTDFMLKSPEQWANEQMALRYNTNIADTDLDGEFPYICWEHLKEEHEILRQWFTDDGKLNLTLQSASIINRLSGPIGDGMGWDFKANGDPEVRMVYFKSTLIAAARAAALIPYKNRDDANQQFSGIAKLVHGAYSMRSEIHRWRGFEYNKVNYTPAEVSHRWVAMQTYNFLVRLGVPRPARLWSLSKCNTVFGAFDEPTDLI
jgi:hypothetical protein